MKKFYAIVLGLVLLILMSTCQETVDNSKFKADTWEVQIPEIGFTSSPRAADLNNDGVLDLVLGGSGAEFDSIVHGVVALNGKDGDLLWKVPARNQVVGSAVFKNLTSDDIPDIIIGGRSAILYAIDGAKGTVIWEFLPDSDTLDLRNDTKLLNFFNPQFVPDQDGDGEEDLLLPFGGYVKAKPDETERPAGRLLIISSKNGQVLNEFYMPDGKETYMSPLAHRFKGDEELSIIFGTGGETIKGNLYRIAFKDLLANDASKVHILASGKEKGFIGPPVLVDMNEDGIRDLVVNAVEGKMICIDGKTEKEIWKVDVNPKFHVYTIPTPGFFVGDDDTPDFYSGYSFSPWSDDKLAIHVLIDGTNGNLVSTDTTGVFQYASSVVYDFNDDGVDEVVLASNAYTEIPNSGFEGKFYMNELKILNFETDNFRPLRKMELGANLGTTPLLTDLDDDGWLDVISCYSRDGEKLYSFKNGVVERIELKAKKRTPIRWGTYMGARYDAVW